MNNIEIVQALMVKLNTLSLTSVKDWETGIAMAQGLLALKKNLEDAEKAKQKAEEARIEELKEQRKKQLEDAAAQGLEVIGGETIRINGDGSTEVLIP